MDIDYLIIGQGLAGSLLAWELIQRDCTVVVVDSGRENASQVAAGLVNPVTGMRFVKADAVDILLPAARRVYQRLAEFFGRDFLIEKPMLRLLSTEAEISQCRKRLQDPAYRAYLAGIKPPGQLDYPFDTRIAALEQKQTGYLLTRPLLASLKDYFVSLNSYRQETLDYRDIQIRPTLKWRALKPKKLIFCEGFRALRNPWFSDLPFQPAKGQILTLATEQTLPQQILNYGNWLVPLDRNRFRIGATFEHAVVDTAVTETGRRQLLQRLGNIYSKLATAEVVDQQANIRPCTQDRHPFVGHHPKYPELWIFNGFGAKGSLQIPWYSRHLADVLLTAEPLQAGCALNRL